MTIRWLREDEYPQVNSLLELHGWARINETAARVLGAFDGEILVEVFVLQLYPVLGPLVRADSTYRDHGETSLALVDEMAEYLDRMDARGALAICDHPATERLCKRFGMTRIDKPIYADRQL